MARAAKGAGTIRKKLVTRAGKTYEYWEARVTVGHDAGTGRQIQRSFTGKTQREVLEKLQAAAVAIGKGTYTPPSRLTVAQWLDIWTADYLGGRKPSTVTEYKRIIARRISPAIGAVKLDELHTHTVQSFINGLGLGAASTRVTHAILHAALEKAVDLGYIPRNPADRIARPKYRQRDIKPLDDDQAATLLRAVKGHKLEHIVTVALFTGLRVSELCGLMWDAIDFKRGTITIDKQLSTPAARRVSLFVSPKNGKTRVITPAPTVFSALTAQRRRQNETRLRVGELWSNPHDLVFTRDDGAPWRQSSVDRLFAIVCDGCGLSGVRFHDLRHTYAVNAIRAGDDVKTVQSNLGHSSAAFTLDRYAHFTEQMSRDSADRMERFIDALGV